MELIRKIFSSAVLLLALLAVAMSGCLEAAPTVTGPADSFEITFSGKDINVALEMDWKGFFGGDDKDTTSFDGVTTFTVKNTVVQDGWFESWYTTLIVDGNVYYEGKSNEIDFTLSSVNPIYFKEYNSTSIDFDTEPDESELYTITY